MKKFTVLMALLILLSGCSAASDTIKTEEKTEVSSGQDNTEKNEDGVKQEELNEKTSEMYVEQSQLNDDEEDILELMGIDNSGLICDFAVDENVKSVHISVYKYDNGQWKEYTRDSRLFGDTDGRIAFIYEDMGNGMKISFQSENDRGSTEFYPDTEDIYSSGCMQAKINTRKSIEYNEEIPVAIQVYAGDSGPSSVGLESFFEPETLNGCEDAYVVTVEFSDMKLDEHRDNEEVKEKQMQRAL